MGDAPNVTIPCDGEYGVDWPDTEWLEKLLGEIIVDVGLVDVDSGLGVASLNPTSEKTSTILTLLLPTKEPVVLSTEYQNAGRQAVKRVKKGGIQSPLLSSSDPFGGHKWGWGICGTYDVGKMYLDAK